MFDASYFSSKITPTARILHFMRYFSLIPDPILMYSTNVKDSEMPIADWLPYPSPLYINIEFGLREAHEYFRQYLRLRKV